MDLDLSQDSASLTASLVDVRSVSGEEKALAGLIDAALRGLPHLTVHTDGNALIARTTLGRPQRVIVAGHIDTVPVAGNLPSRREQGLLYGCGSCDMKAGVAVALRLAARLDRPSADVTWVFYDCEEVEAERNGLLRLSRNCPGLLEGDMAVLMEPTGGVIEGGCQGTLRAEVRTFGKRAHSARSWKGHNAIHAAAEILSLLRSHEPRRPEVDGLTYHEGLNAVGIRGGVAGNVIPDECVVTVNYRFAPDRSELAGGRARARGVRGLRRRRSPTRRRAPGRGSATRRPRPCSPPWVASPGPSSAGPTWPGSRRSACPPSTTARGTPSLPIPRTSTWT